MVDKKKVRFKYKSTKEDDNIMIMFQSDRKTIELKLLEVYTKYEKN